MAFLTGSFGATRHYPRLLRAIGAVLPLKYLLDLIKGIYLHGQQIWDKPVAVAVLAAGGSSEWLLQCALSAGSRERVSSRARAVIRLVMQVENVIAFATEQEPAGLEIRVNFGVFAGRDATSAELEELGKLLVPEAGEVSIVGEQRHEISEDAEIVLHQVRVSVSPENVPDDPGERKEFCERLVTLAEIWARQCINERSSEITDL